MAQVYLPEPLLQFSAGETQLEMAVEDYRGLIAALESRFPGIAAAIDADFAVVIDGDIINEPLLEPIAPDSEVHFLHRIGGG